MLNQRIETSGMSRIIVTASRSPPALFLYQCAEGLWAKAPQNQRAAWPRAATTTKTTSAATTANSSMQYLCILLLWGLILDHLGPLGCLVGALGIDLGPFWDHWVVFFVPWGAIFASFGVSGRPLGSLWGLLRCRLLKGRPGNPGESSSKPILANC